MYNPSINTFTTTNRTYKENISVMANNPNQPTTFGLFERFKKPIAGIALAMGVLSVNTACSSEVSADKPPTTASASATPGATETPVVTKTPATQETTKPAGEIIGGIDVSNLSPASRELAARLTPEKVATMTEAERDKAFTINLTDINTGKGAGEDQARSYVERTFVLLASMYSAGATQADNEKFKNNAAAGYSEFNQTELLDPTISAIFNKDIDDSSKLRDYFFAERHYGHQRYIDTMREDPDHSSNPAVKAIKDYSIVFSLDTSSIKVSMNGSGETSDPISAKYAINFEERNNYTPAQLQQFAQVGDNPAKYGDVKGKLSLSIEYAKVNISGDAGDKVQPDNLIATMESNQNSDGTVS